MGGMNKWSLETRIKFNRLMFVAVLIFLGYCAVATFIIPWLMTPTVLRITLTPVLP